jgi:hypothetical protein
VLCCEPPTTPETKPEHQLGGTRRIAPLWFSGRVESPGRLRVCSNSWGRTNSLALAPGSGCWPVKEKICVYDKTRVVLTLVLVGFNVGFPCLEKKMGGNRKKGHLYQNFSEIIYSLFGLKRKTKTQRRSWHVKYRTNTY